MPDGYDHVTRICRPREFARALAAMVSEQKGLQGSEEVTTHVIDGYKFKTKHKTQLVYHGPVVYEENPYDRAINASTKLESILLPIFTKKIEYSSQREYRFFIVTSEEPSEEILKLSVSPSMLGSVGECDKGAIPQNFPKIIPFEDSIMSSDQHAKNIDAIAINTKPNRYEQPRIPNLPFPDDFVNDPSVPISVNAKESEDIPQNIHEMLTTYTAIETLRYVVGGSFKVGRIPRKRYVDVASSAWHADRCIRRLCTEFEDPIKNISVNDENFVVITIKFPRESGSKGTILVSPYGTVTHKITSGGRFIFGYSETGWFLTKDTSDTLKEMGLHIRPNSSKI